jgi:hypothetical protein
VQLLTIQEHLVSKLRLARQASFYFASVSNHENLSRAAMKKFRCTITADAIRASRVFNLAPE